VNVFSGKLWDERQLFMTSSDPGNCSVAIPESSLEAKIRQARSTWLFVY